MASKTVMIRFSSFLPISPPPFRISAPYECVFYNRVRVRINRGSSSFNCSQTNDNATLQKQSLMSMWVHKFFKRMISSSNFVAIARLVVLARKDPRTASLFSSLLDPVTLTCTLFPLRAFLRKMNKSKKSSIGACPIMNFKVSPSFTVSICYCYSFC